MLFDIMHCGHRKEHSLPSNMGVDITISQAREFFEPEFLTRDDANPARGVLSPGDFTPRWGKSSTHRLNDNLFIYCGMPSTPPYPI